MQIVKIMMLSVIGSHFDCLISSTPLISFNLNLSVVDLSQGWDNRISFTPSPPMAIMKSGSGLLIWVSNMATSEWKTRTVLTEGTLHLILADWPRGRGVVWVICMGTTALGACHLKREEDFPFNSSSFLFFCPRSSDFHIPLYVLHSDQFAKLNIL